MTKHKRDDTRQAMQEAQKLIKQKRYEDARSILITVDHPTADKWLARINQIMGETPTPKPSSQGEKKKKGCLRRIVEVSAAFVLVMCGLIFLATLTDPDSEAAPTLIAEVAATVTDGPSPTPSDTPVPSATFTEAPTATVTNTVVPSATPTITSTPVPSATRELSSFGLALLQIEGVQSVGMDSIIYDRNNKPIATAELYVESGYNTIETARAFLQTLYEIERTTDVVSPSVIVDDGDNRINYALNEQRGEWRATEMGTGETITYPEVQAEQRAVVESVSRRTYYSEGSARVRECPRTDCNVMDDLVEGEAVIVVGYSDGDVFRGSTRWYQLDNGWFVHSELLTSVAPVQPQSPSVNQSSSNTTTNRVPLNCDEAVEMGLTAEQAGRYSHLDRDEDGVACYGD